MKRGLPVLSACACALALVAGCGSSNSASTGVTTTTTIVGGVTSTKTVATGTKSTKSAGGLQPSSTTPKYAAPPASAPVQSGVVQIEYRNIAINPDALKVKVGSTIKWTNYDPVSHNVTSKGGDGGAGSQSFASKNFGEGGTFEFKATKAGVIHYLCTIHPVSMNGTIEVVS
jgi:plastocyanin